MQQGGRDGVIRAEAVKLGVGREHDPVSENSPRERRDVIRRHKIPSGRFLNVPARLARSFRWTRRASSLVYKPKKQKMLACQNEIGAVGAWPKAGRGYVRLSRVESFSCAKGFRG